MSSYADYRGGRGGGRERALLPHLPHVSPVLQRVSLQGVRGKWAEVVGCPPVEEVAIPKVDVADRRGESGLLSQVGKVGELRLTHRLALEQLVALRPWGLSTADGLKVG